MEIYKCLQCGYECREPIKVYDNGHYDIECPNCGSEDIEKMEEETLTNGWIKAWKELPEDGDNYITVSEHGCVNVLRFNVKHQMWNVTDNETDTEIKVLYWRKLPPLPPMRERPPYDMERDAELVNKAFKKEEEE